MGLAKNQHIKQIHNTRGRASLWVELVAASRIHVGGDTLTFHILPALQDFVFSDPDLGENTTRSQSTSHYQCFSTRLDLLTSISTLYVRWTFGTHLRMRYECVIYNPAWVYLSVCVNGLAIFVCWARFETVSFIIELVPHLELYVCVLCTGIRSVLSVCVYEWVSPMCL